jgi:magnesium transporter
MAPATRILLVRRPDGELIELDPGEQSADRLLAADPGTLVWLDLLSPDSADLALLTEKIGLHQLAREDLEKQHQRPKLDTYPGQHVLVAYEVLDQPKRNDDDFSLAEVHFIAGRDYVVSVHWEPSTALAQVQQRWRQRVPAVGASAGELLHTILDTIADGYFPLLDRLSDRIDQLQDEIMSGNGAAPGRAVLREVLHIKRRLLDLRRVVASLRDVVNGLLRRDAPVVQESLLPYYQDLYDHLVRVLDNIDVAREMLTATLDANLSVTSNNLNVVVKRLTAFTVILMIPTLIAGIYGMNFARIPELAWPFGYAFALGLMATSMIVAYVYFRRHDWF